MRTTTEERAALERVARRARCRGPMPHSLRIGLLARIEPANCNAFSSRAPLPTREKHWLSVSAAWRFRWRAS
jgi:phytoene/squalene synthetase